MTLKRGAILKIRDIASLHKEIEELANAFSVPPLRLPSDKLLTQRDLKRLTDFQPIPVQATGNRKYVCLGNLALFRMLKHSLDENADIHCLIFNEIDSKYIKRRTLTELIFYPAIAGPAAVDLPRLYLGFVAAVKAGHFPEIGDAKPARVFSKLFDVDPRSLPAVGSDTSNAPATLASSETDPESSSVVALQRDNGKEV